MSDGIRRMLVGVIASVFSGLAAGQSLPNLFPFLNSAGALETYNAGGPVDLNGPFFQSFGTNGRSCGTCHRPAEAWSISASEVKFRFEATAGTDPIFRPVDGSVCDHNVNTSTLAGRRAAYALLTNRGLLRIAIAVPPNAEFTVVGVVNPYGCNEPDTLSMYRRPLPAANLRFLSAVMWDGRESSPQTGTEKIAYATNPADLQTDLAHQALDATNGHAQATTPLTTHQQQAIVNFEMGLSAAQAYDYRAGALNSAGAQAGPTNLANQTTPSFFIGINDPLGGNPHGTPFTPAIFDLFNAWTNLRHSDEGSTSQRASIARGQAVFNSKRISITGVTGLNDALNIDSIPGTCGTCHDAPDAGNHSLAVALNIGVSDVDSPLDVSYLPTFTLQNKSTHQTVMTTDPGRALITGLWADVGKVKGPVLRGLPARAPYFHNGSAQSLSDVLSFYDTRFKIGFTEQEKEDLIAFLNAL